MKISRWNIIYATLGEIITSLVLKLFIPISIIGFMYSVYEFIKGYTKLVTFFAAIIFLASTVLFCGATWRKWYLLDILLMKVQETSLLPASEIEYGEAIPGFARSIIGYEMIIGKERNASLRLQVFHKLVTKPVADYYKIYYLKYTRTVVGFDTVTLQVESSEKSKINKRKSLAQIKNERKRLRSKKVVEVKKEEGITIPKYDRNTIWNLTKHHAWRPALIIMYNIVTILAIIFFSLHAVKTGESWYPVASQKYIKVVLCLLVIEIIWLVVYFKGFKGYFLDMLIPQIATTTMLPVEKVTSKKCIYDFSGNVIGLILVIEVGMEQPQRLIIYNNVSEYWNGFDMHPKYSHRQIRYVPREYDIESVRLYYLKNSKLVVKMETSSCCEKLSNKWSI